MGGNGTIEQNWSQLNKIYKIMPNTVESMSHTEKPDSPEQSSPEARTGEKEMSREQEIKQEVKRRALKDSEDYFILQQQRLERLLNDEQFQMQMEGFLQRMSAGEEVSDEELKTAFGEGADEDTAKIMRDSLKQCIPVSKLENPYQHLSKVLREGFSPVIRLMNTERNFGTEKSWYVNNPLGRETLAKINAQVESEFAEKGGN